MEENEIKNEDNKLLNFKRNLEYALKQQYEEQLNKKVLNTEEVNLIEIINIRYYDKFVLDTKIKDLLLTIKDVYIVEMKDGQNTTFELYTKDVNHKIAQVNVEGKIEFVDEKFDNKTTLEQIEQKNEDNFNKELKDVEQLEEKQENDKKDELKEKEETIETDDKYIDIGQLEKDLELDKGDIKSCTKVITTGKYNVFRNAVPESKKFDTIKLVYISSQDSFRFVGLRAGQKPKFLDSIESSKETMKKSISINKNGSEIERENIKGLMKLKGNEDYDFSVKIGQYGCIELNALRKDNVTNKYISTQIETTSQKPNQREIDELMNKNKNVRINEEIDRFEEKKNEEGRDAKVDIKDISDQGEKERDERTLDENVKKYYYDA